MISFPAIATDKIRVVIHDSIDGESRITEIEAFHLNDLPRPKISAGDKVKNVKGAKGHTNSIVYFRTEAFDRDGTIKYYELDFGDDTATYEWRSDREIAGATPRLAHVHVYESEGVYEVKLRVVDDSNEVAETKILVTITDPPKRNSVTSRHLTAAQKIR
jgi:hypothetical protein